MNTMHVADSRLNDMLETIMAERQRGFEPGDDLPARRADIAKAADLLLRFYGEGALDRAKLLEQRPGAGPFAKWVRIDLERRGSDRSSS